MNEPKRCSKCGAPIAPNQTLCHEHFVDYWLDDEFEGEGGIVPMYHEDWGDEDDDEIDEDDEDDDKVENTIASSNLKEVPDLSFQAHGDATSYGCQMCGNEWKSLNAEGYCSSCWTVWNS